MICHYFDLTGLLPAHMVRLSGALDVLTPDPAEEGQEEAAYGPLDLTPAQLEQMCSESESIDGLLDAMERRQSGQDPSHGDPLVAKDGHAVMHAMAGRRPIVGSRSASMASVVAHGGAGSAPGASRRNSSMTVTVTKELGDP